MCGLSGFIQPKLDKNSALRIIKTMTDAIQHRGPDDEGYWLHPNNGLVFGHRRLAIQDLSAAGHQPMFSASKRFTIIFNGEIYNHFELRALLEIENTYHWQGHSDTETLLAGFEHWGIEETIIKAEGMFAFAVFDEHKNTLTLGRDRLGEKPLYYGWQGESFMFASTLSPFKVHPHFLNKIDKNVLALYFRYACVPGEHCIFEGIKKLAAGSLLTMSMLDKKISIKKYWSLTQVISKAKAQVFSGSDEDAVEKLSELLSRSVKQQMLSDLPLGAFLSGGVDSSTVVALMQAQSSVPINTFSIGFAEDTFDEAKYAKQVAQHLGTNHTELYLSAEDILKTIPLLPTIYDEPFADSSQIPTFLVSKMTKQKVSVALSGDGGDELFAGYNRYLATDRLWSILKKIPLVLRKLLAKFLILLPEAAWDKIASFLFLSKKFSHIGFKLHKAATVLTAKTSAELYLKLISQWQEAEDLIRFDKAECAINTEDNPFMAQNLSDVEWMMASDTLGYLADDILVKVDRAAMAVSLETRVPMLNPDLVAFAWSLPMSVKIKNGVTKWPLKELLYRYVPKHLVDRPKSGFAVPLDEWLRGPLKNWAEKLLDETRITQQGFLKSEMIQTLWHEHLSGKRNRANQLWCVLMFQAWLEQQGNTR